MKICSGCQGTGVLGEYSTAKQHECPWCDSHGTVTTEVNNAYERVFRLTPNVGKFCVAWGNGKKVERIKPRKA